jgi:hypothetical protein
VHVLDYNCDGTKFATSGKDMKVRVYDDGKKAKPSEMQAGDYPLHNNRVYALKFLNDDPNVLMTAG